MGYDDIVVKLMEYPRCQIGDKMWLKPDVDGNTPLHIAVKNQHLFLIKILITKIQKEPEGIAFHINNTISQKEWQPIIDKIKSGLLYPEKHAGWIMMQINASNPYPTLCISIFGCVESLLVIEHVLYTLSRLIRSHLAEKKIP